MSNSAQLLAPTSLPSSSDPYPMITLDLRNKDGAYLYCRIGRDTSIALKRSAYIAIRRRINETLHGNPSNPYDFISSTMASSDVSAGATATTLETSTGFAPGQQCCVQLDGNRCEFLQIGSMRTNTIMIDRGGGFLQSHFASDLVTNGADCSNIFVPGGFIYEITPNNDSGQTVVMCLDAEFFPSELDRSGRTDLASPKSGGSRKRNQDRDAAVVRLLEDNPEMSIPEIAIEI
jgi:hypothetical protein